MYREFIFLTPEDFAAIIRQNTFRPITDIKDFMQLIIKNNELE
jgi:hypothetical protein